MIGLILFFTLIYNSHNAIKVLAPTGPPNLSNNRQSMLKLINQVRLGLKKNLTTLYLDQTLNKLAQQHSIDMVKRDYFDHVNPDKQTPGDRAKVINFNYAVGQNIAIGSNVSQIHQSLMKSPGHYKNTIDPDWTRCGIGFHSNKLGWIYATIVFSTRDLKKYPPSASDYQKVLESISRYILSNNKQLVEQDKVLSQHIKKWLKQGSKIPILQYLKSVKYSKNGGAYSNTSVKMPWSTNLIEQMKKLNYFIQPNKKFTKFGVNLELIQQKFTIVVVYGTK